MRREVLASLRHETAQGLGAAVLQELLDLRSFNGLIQDLAPHFEGALSRVGLSAFADPRRRSLKNIAFALGARAQ